MPTPEDEKTDVTLTKLEVAVWQLDVALRLFHEGDYLSSLTLAGAAEEILGKLCERVGKPVTVESVIAFHLEDTDPSLAVKDRKKVLLGVLNRARNAAKHVIDTNDTHFVVEQAFPLQMIMRAMPMARILGMPPPGEAKMVAWIRAHPEATQ